MNAKFYLILLLLCALFGVWTYLAHQHFSEVETIYSELSELPVYAYVADTTKVQPLLSELGKIPDLAAVNHETGFQAALELIEAYGLPLNESTIADYHFPDLISITLSSGKAGITAKARVMDLLRTHLEETDIDSQSQAFAMLLLKLSRLRFTFIIFNVFAGLLMFLVFIFSRLSYEMHIYLKQKRRLISVVDVMRHNKLHAIHSWMMLVAPIALVLLVYYGGSYLKRWDFLVDWLSFAVMGTVSLIATIAIFLSLRVYEHDPALNNCDPVQVINPDEEAQDA